MKKVKIYTSPNCPYCVRAKSLLKSEAIDFEEVNLSWDDEKPWKDLQARTGMKTVPQIFFGDQCIGGFTELDELVRAGQLPKMLA